MYRFGYGAALLARNGAVWFFLLLAPVAWAQDRTIIAFGDSLTQGFGLPADQGFVPQLERWLNDQGAGVNCDFGLGLA